MAGQLRVVAPLATSDLTTQAKPAGFVGRWGMFTYNNLKYPPEAEEHTCGHSCIASMHDIHGRSKMPHHLRTEQGKGSANDGRKHFPNQLIVGHLYQAYPPVNFFGMLKFTIRETLIQAMHDVGLKTQEVYPEMLGAEKNKFDKSHINLLNALKNRPFPVVVLLDMQPLFNVSSLHWGMICGADDKSVHLASWGRVMQVPWGDFSRAWHCKKLPYPNNFYALYVWP